MCGEKANEFTRAALQQDISSLLAIAVCACAALIVWLIVCFAFEVLQGRMDAKELGDTNVDGSDARSL
jgi:hypothetical protein